ncbi:MAG: hypothetical protein IJS29_00660 [Selenomonadaceae bacterium]|nr:hypothetical protein [Selenomonadaceae bacterium]
MKKILLIIIPLLLIIAVSIGAVIAYTSMGKSSTNPIKILRQSISNHDAEKFYKIVDVDAVLDSAAKEILTAQINSTVDALAYSTQNYMTAYENLKPNFVTAAKNYLDEYISTGKINFQEPLTPAQKFFKSSAVDSCTIKSFSKLKTEDGETHAKLEFLNERLNFYFEIDLTLEKVEKNSWRIVNATGFENYFNGYRRATRKSLEKLNAPIRDKISEIVQLKGFSAGIAEGDEYGFSQTLKMTIRADIKSDKPISRIVGNIIIEGKDDREGVTPFSMDMVGRENGVQDFDVVKTLNPFVREDVEVMRHGLRRDNLHIEVMQIDFADGTTLKEFDELPENN